MEIAFQSLQWVPKSVFVQKKTQTKTAKNAILS